MSTAEGRFPDGHVAAYRARVFAERRRMCGQLRDVRGLSDRVLAEICAANADTEYGRAHGFASIRTHEDWTAAVPINDFAALAPAIERMAAGEHDVLTAEDPLVYFTSSGTTGAHKKVPMTARFMAGGFFPYFYAAWAPLVEHHPAVVDRGDAVLNLKHDPLPVVSVTGSGREHLGASQVDFGSVFGEPLAAEPGSVATWSTIPVPVPPDDHHEKAYLRLRLAVEADLRCVIGINPATVAAVTHQLRRWWPRIVREVRDGTLGGRRVGTPAPGRAAELDRLAARHDPLLPGHVWPNMEVIFCWTGGVAELYLPRVREEFGPGVEVLPAPVAASEGPIGVTLDRHASAGSLVAPAAVHEFLDADEPVTPDAATVRAHELEPGREYHVIYSHVGGMYRYHGGDVVRVVDHEGGAPRVEYAGRATVSDVAGERLREGPVLRALADALRRGGLEVRNAACRASESGYEFALAPSSPWSPAELAAVQGRLDRALGDVAAGYRRARASGALGAARVRAIEPEAFARDWHERVADGVRPAQVKDRLFRNEDAAWDRLVAPAPNARVAREARHG